MSKVLAVMGLNWFYWRDLVAGIMVSSRHLAVKSRKTTTDSNQFTEQDGSVSNDFDQVILGVLLWTVYLLSINTDAGCQNRRSVTPTVILPCWYQI